MINPYEDYTDTNPGVAARRRFTVGVIFDFYFGDGSEARREYNEQSVAVGARVQDEDLGICEAAQRGLKSRAYGAGRLSVLTRGWRTSVSAVAGGLFEERCGRRRRGPLISNNSATWKFSVATQSKSEGDALEEDSLISAGVVSGARPPGAAAQVTAIKAAG